MDERRISTRLGSLMTELFHEEHDKNITIVPMILAKLYRPLSEVRSGIGFFEESKPLLQLWMIEHLCPASQPCAIDYAIYDLVNY